jgi:hypothetical protein
VSALEGLPTRLPAPGPDALHSGAQRAAQRVQNLLARAGHPASIKVSVHPGGARISYPKEHAQLVRAAMAAERARIRAELGGRR